MSAIELDEMTETGVAALRAGRTAEARRLLNQALTQDPNNPDAHHHLGLIAFDAGNLKDAEESFRAALDACEARLTNSEADLGDAFSLSRAKARSLHALALVMRRTNRRGDAVLLLEELLKDDERDGLGGRYLLAEEYHRQGKLRRAMRMYERETEDPGSCFLLALALIEINAPQARTGHALLRGFASNRYMAPIFLREKYAPFERNSHSREGVEWAVESAASSRDLWERVPNALGSCDTGGSTRTWQPGAESSLRSQEPWRSFIFSKCASHSSTCVSSLRLPSTLT